MDPISKAEEASRDISEILGDNHVSTVLFGPPVTGNYVEGRTKIPLFVVVDRFDADTAVKISQIHRKWRSENIEGPYVAEMSDMEGMSDSIPDELLDVIMDYHVIEGMDVIKALPKLNQEHMRAQSELALRRYIYNLRWRLTQVLGDEAKTMSYLSNLAFQCQLSIRVTHRLTHPWLKSSEEHLAKFNEQFPEGATELEKLMGVVFEGKELEGKPEQLATDVIDKVLNPLLRTIDDLGH